MNHGCRTIYLLLVTLSAVAIGILFWLDLNQRDADRRQVAAIRVTTYEVNRALCLRKTELRVGIRDSLAYLKEHPHGAPGIPRSLIAAGIQTDQITLASLRDVHCPPTPLS